MAGKTNLRPKAIVPAERARPVAGIPLEDLKRAVRAAAVVRWFNGKDLVEDVSPREVLRRLEPMPSGCEVAVMARTSRSRRAFAVDASCSEAGEGQVFIHTSFLY